MFLAIKRLVTIGIRLITSFQYLKYIQVKVEADTNNPISQIVKNATNGAIQIKYCGLKVFE